MGVVVGRGELLDDRTELPLGVLPACEAEVRDAERLTDRCLRRFELLGPLERDGRLCGQAAAKPFLAFAEQLVRVVSY
jgi:hypothetical protein